MSADELRLARIARHQHGVFSRAQALQCGFVARVIARRVGAGRWRVVADGVYASASVRLGPRARWWVGLVRLGEHAVLSHFTAARVWQLPVSEPAVHITVAPTVRCRPPDDVTVHRLRLEPADVTEADGFPVTSLPRTVLDCSSALDDAPAAQLLAHALRDTRLGIDELYDAVGARVPRQAKPRLLQLLAAQDPAARQPLP